MSGDRPILAPTVREGSLTAYAVESRNEVVSSDVRGHLVLHLADAGRNPDAFGGQAALHLPPGEMSPTSIWRRASSGEAMSSVPHVTSRSDSRMRCRSWRICGRRRGGQKALTRDAANSLPRPAPSPRSGRASRGTRSTTNSPWSRPSCPSTPSRTEARPASSMSRFRRRCAGFGLSPVGRRLSAPLERPQRRGRQTAPRALPKRGARIPGRADLPLEPRQLSARWNRDVCLRLPQRGGRGRCALGRSADE